MRQREGLIKAFGLDAGRVVVDWAIEHGIELQVEQVLANGLSGAPVVVVSAQPRRGRWRKLVVKVCMPDGVNDLCEPGRHLRALAHSASFAQDHLMEYAYDPQRIPGGGWVVFQQYAGGPLNRPTLASLLDSVVDPQRRLEPRSSAGEVAEASAAVVRSVLNDWMPTDGLPGDSARVDSVEFLAWNLGRRLEKGGSLRSWVQDKAPDLLDPATRWISYGGTALPNPFSLALDRSLTEGRNVWALLGAAHGDLQPENIIVPLRHGSVPARRQLLMSNFLLVDLERFDDRVPLSFDPTHLQLSIVARHLHRLSDDGRQALILFLVDPTDDHSGDLVAPWVQKVVSAITDTATAWAGEVYVPEWSDQRTLSLLACALIFAGRRTTSDAQRGWFLGLAAHAAEAYLRSDGATAGAALPPPRSHPPLIEVEPAAPTWRSMEVPKLPGAGASLTAPADRREPPVGPDEPWTTSPAEDDDDRVGPGLPAGPAIAEPGVAKGAPPAVMPGAPARRRSSPLDPALRIAADTLAEQVTAQWEEALEGRRLDWPGPVRVRWQRSARPVVGPVADALGPVPDLSCADRPPTPRDTTAIDARSVEAPNAAGLRDGDVRDLFSDVYCRLRRPGRLVILGGGGAGKTAAAIRLVLDVLHYRAAFTDPDERAEIAVPVILTPHDWDPESQELTAWLEQRLAADYSLSRSRRQGIDDARALVRAKRVALVLDGLDDMPERVRKAALAALNRVELRAVVLSRSREMVDAAAGAHLVAAVAVELQPVDATEAADYLVRCGVDPLPGSWQRLVDRVRHEPRCPAAQALDSPLMLGLMRDTYTSVDEVDELLDAERFPTRVAVEDHLLRRVLPVAYQSRPGERRPRYAHDQAKRWLTSFARQMHRDNTRDLAWWRLSEVVSPLRRRIVDASVTGVLSALLFGALGALVGVPLRGLLGGFALGPCAAAFDALVVSRDGRAARQASVRRIAVGYVLTAMATGVLTGILLVGAKQGVVDGLVAGTAVGLFAGVPAVIWAGRSIVFISRPAASADGLLSPAACWAQNRRQAMLFGSLLGVTVGITLVATCLLVDEPLARVAMPVLAEPIVMTAFTMVLSLRAKTTLAAAQLWFLCRGRYPVRVIAFLEDARARNVLRSAGSVYQFRHARLQDVLSEAPPAGVAGGVEFPYGSR